MVKTLIVVVHRFLEVRAISITSGSLTVAVYRGGGILTQCISVHGTDRQTADRQTDRILLILHLIQPQF